MKINVSIIQWLLLLIFSLLQLFFLDPIICYYWKKWPQRPVPCERMLASRTGTRLSSVRPDKLCSQSYLNAQIQLWRHTNGQCTCYYWGGGVATALEAGGPRVAAGTSPARCRRGGAGALALAVAPLVAAAGGGDQRQQFSILEHSRPASVQLLRKWTKFSWLLLGTFFWSARRSRPCFL